MHAKALLTKKNHITFLLLLPKLQYFTKLKILLVIIVKNVIFLFPVCEETFPKMTFNELLCYEITDFVTTAQCLKHIDVFKVAIGTRLAKSVNEYYFIPLA